MTEASVHSNRLIPYKWELLVLLWVAFCFNQADRQVYNNLLPQIQGDLGLSNEQAGPFCLFRPRSANTTRNRPCAGHFKPVGV